MAEDEWWDAWFDQQEANEAEARRYAENSAELLEFDSEDDRDAYIVETFEQRLAELEAE